jgi:hypothetical protein
MKKTAQNKVTTQKFIEIQDIIDNVVIFSNNRACTVMEIMATNFSLQSIEEQQVKIYSYASFLNSLSFPIQIIVISRQLDISSYIKQLEAAEKSAPNNSLASHIKDYKEFVSQLIQSRTVLDKKFYIAINYSFLEKGATSVAASRNKDVFVKDAKNMLGSKARSIEQQLLRVGLKSKQLNKAELIKLYYEIYNQDAGDIDFSNSAHSPFINSSLNFPKGGQK